MAKKNQVIDEVETDETEEVEAEEIVQAVRPKDLASELEINAKSLRGFLRDNFPRSTEDKNTSWSLTEEMVEAARAHFLPEDEDEEEETDEEA